MVECVTKQFKSKWESSVAGSLSKNKIHFKYEPGFFRINSRITYTPDFLLETLRDKKTIILEPHGIMDPEDFCKFSMFRKMYGDDYFLILLVRNDDVPFVPREAYDDIWPIEYFELLAEKLRKENPVPSATVPCY